MLRVFSGIAIAVSWFYIALYTTKEIQVDYHTFDNEESIA